VLAVDTRAEKNIVVGGLYQGAHTEKFCEAFRSVGVGLCPLNVLVGWPWADCRHQSRGSGVSPAPWNVSSLIPAYPVHGLGLLPRQMIWSALIAGGGQS
jgi:hypothetical protein